MRTKLLSFFHFIGDGAGGFVALRKMIDHVLIALWVAILAQLVGGLDLVDYDAKADDTPEIGLKLFFGDLADVYGRRQTVLIRIDQAGKRGTELFAFQDAHRSIYMHGDVIPGGDFHFR